MHLIPLKRLSLALSFSLSLVLQSPLLSNQPDDLSQHAQDSWASSEGLPSSMVNNSVCVITGSYNDQDVDVVLLGPEPLVLARTYSNQDTSDKLGSSWKSSLSNEIIRSLGYLKGDEITCAFVDQANGSRHTYTHPRSKHYKNHHTLAYRTYINKGMACGGSELSSRSHPKYNTLHYLQKEDQFHLLTGEGDFAVYNKAGYTSEENVRYTTLGISKRNGHFLAFEFTKPKDIPTMKCIMRNSRTNEEYSRCTRVKEEKKDSASLTYKTDSGDTIRYNFAKSTWTEKDPNRGKDYFDKWFINRVERSNKPNVSYTYTESAREHWKQITKKSLPEHRYLATEYYHKGENTLYKKEKVTLKAGDFRLDRVKKQYAPVGPDKNPINIFRFEYDANLTDHLRELLDGTTKVFNAYNHKTKYEFDREHRLKKITRYNGVDPYSDFTYERFVWGAKDTHLEGHLLVRYLQESATNNIQYLHQYEYDGHGNVTKKTLWGRLSGRNGIHPVVDGNHIPVENGCEKDSVHYFYNAEHLLVAEIDSAGKTTELVYVPGTDLVCAKFIHWDGQIRQREFIFHDHNTTVVGKIVDDGCGRDANDLTSVTQRLITSIQPTTTKPIGLPHVVDEKYLDFTTGKERLLKRTVNSYSRKGEIKRQEVYDSDAVFCYALTWEYDAHGNVISHTDAQGETVQKVYDANDNLIEEHHSDQTLKNTYDFSNRLIKQEEILSDGSRYVTSHKYDYLNRRVQSTNTYGLDSKLFYDEFNRLRSTHSPQLLNPQGVAVTPIAESFYDCTGNAVLIRNPKGDLSYMDYSTRNQPTRVTYPDRTSECFFYQLNGQLAEKIAQNGSKTIFIRDPLGRVLTETVLSPAGDILKCETFTYNAFNIISKVDAEGLQTFYSYDGAGRLTKMVAGERLEEYFYDSLGRVKEKRDWIDSNNFKCQCFSYDVMNRITEETIQDAQGVVYELRRYAYDKRGNRIMEQVGDQITRTEYDVHGKPVKITNALNEVTHITYKTDHFNDLGQRVLKTTTTDPLGYQTVDIYDAANQRVQTKRMNLMGTCVSQQIMVYDLVGNQVKTIDVVMEGGEETRRVETLFEYDGCNRLVKQVEAAGTLDQKCTYYFYNELGQKVACVNPNGTILHYGYDALDRVNICNSSDESIQYQYQYNKNDDLIKVSDLVANTDTIRVYDLQGNLISEMLANGLKVCYAYDRIGRVIRLDLPDQTSVEYLYGAFNLTAIRRIINGQVAYEYQEQSHNLAGCITKAQLAGECGTVAFAYDLMHRCIAIESAQYQQEIPPGGYDAQGKLCEYQSNSLLYTFAYDDLSQLTNEQGHETHAYQYDSLYNRIEKDGQKQAVNDLNQVLSRGDDRFDYDRNGNMTQQQINGDLVNYSYDALNRLSAVEKNGVTVTYQYDPLDRRMSQVVDNRLQAFLYQGNEEVGLWEQGQLTQFKVLSPTQRGNAIAIELSQTTYVPIYDLFGHVVQLLTLSGNLLESYKYTSFGETQISDPANNSLPASTVGNPWRFANKRYDDFSGLYAFPYRYYHPDLGRWLTPDPAGFVDGSNLYAYVHNSPLVFTDPLGLWGVDPCGGLFHDSDEPPFVSWLLDQQYYPNFEDQFQISPNAEIGFFDQFNFGQSSKPCHEKSSFMDLNKCINPDTNEYFNYPSNLKFSHFYINGILNTSEDWISNAKYIAEIANSNVFGVHAATFGLLHDAKRYINNQLYGLTSEPEKLLREAWLKHFKTAPEDNILIVHCHSRGAVNVRNALMDFPEDLRQRIYVIAVAPGAYISNEICGKVVHLASSWDIVPRLDLKGRKACRQSTTQLKAHKGVRVCEIDHDLQSDTLRERYISVIKDFQK